MQQCIYCFDQVQINFYLLNIMDRSIPMFNRLIIQKMQKKELDLHLKRLNKIRNTHKQINSQQKYLINKKKLQIEEQRRTNIEKQNIILFNKMNKIINREQQNFDTMPLINKTKDQSASVQIQYQNCEILQRIVNQKPTISAKKLYEDRIKKQKILKKMGRYPYILSPLRQPTKQESNSYSQKKLESPTEDMPEHKRESKPKKNQQKQINENKKIIELYRRQQQINGSTIIIEINRLYTKYEFKVTDTTKMDEYKLYLSQSEGNQLFNRFNYNYFKISTFLRIQRKKLCFDFNSDQFKNISKTIKVNENQNPKNLNQRSNIKQISEKQIRKRFRSQEKKQIGQEDQRDQPLPKRKIKHAVNYEEILNEEI